jgi:hypothetical protein
MTREQLILTDETLRVLCALLPYGPVTDQLTRARNGDDGGHLTAAEVRLLERCLNHAADDATRVVTDAALYRATEQFHRQLAGIDLRRCELGAQRSVSVFVWDDLRDGPGAAVHPCLAVASS